MEADLVGNLVKVGLWGDRHAGCNRFLDQERSLNFSGWFVLFFLHPTRAQIQGQWWLGASQGQ